MLKIKKYTCSINNPFCFVKAKYGIKQKQDIIPNPKPHNIKPMERQAKPTAAQNTPIYSRGLSFLIFFMSFMLYPHLIETTLYSIPQQTPYPQRDIDKPLPLC